MFPKWQGVFPAITTKFSPDGALDLQAFTSHLQFLLDHGVDGIITLGTLGEHSVLQQDEKLEIVKTAVDVCAGRVPVLACVAEATTQAACRFVHRVQQAGGDGLMLLPPMLYHSDARETQTYLRTVAAACDLPIMLYNNPIAYGVDITPDMFAELADVPQFVAIKESSDNVRRVTDLRNACGTRYQIFCGVDNLALESLAVGADGWVAGLVTAFPQETVAIYRAAQQGDWQKARALYQWFMPLLHLDVSTKLVQNIKLAETMVGVGNEHVRAPRLPLAGQEREQVTAIIEERLACRPKPDTETVG
ncbi:dihydrodipicolinate synthase family protein [Acanthopleuribacter pedis]|uniref:Dihydrodipicolinate synthase family protein n=1 Tax=Acanthopleuribacter pedis TaxID=442870 RepID=A0A8J7QR08_9BACT|nr:dihydrodipicolinate synthase family protein [Acanthopleuribacter pedis]MBO1322838.1 dihydrodipicolinate synthase family protein [Acanthopleuribacter pedis]